MWFSNGHADDLIDNNRVDGSGWFQTGILPHKFLHLFDNLVCKHSIKLVWIELFHSLLKLIR